LYWGFLAKHLAASLERYRKKKAVARVAIVYTNGIGTAQLLANRFERIFPQVEVLG